MNKVSLFSILILAVGLVELGVGMMFKIMHWPAAGLILVSGLVFTMIGLAALIINRLRRSSGKHHKEDQ